MENTENRSLKKLFKEDLKKAKRAGDNDPAMANIPCFNLPQSNPPDKFKSFKGKKRITSNASELPANINRQSLKMEISHSFKLVGCPLSIKWINQVAGRLKYPDVKEKFYAYFFDEVSREGFSLEQAQEIKDILKWLKGGSPTPKPNPPSVSKGKLEWWKEQKKLAKERIGWAISVRFYLLRSEAYQSLEYAHSAKVLTWFFEKRRVERGKTSPYQTSRKGKQRWIESKEPVKFTYDESRCRGLTNYKFSKALRELHAHGFIDVAKHGTGLQGDSSTYILSDRWERYGTPDFEKVDYPKSSNYGYRRNGIDDKKHE
jgi:hypothetical protein